MPGVLRSSIKNHLQLAAWAEAIAISWLLHRNWTVCKNVSGHGFVDLICTRTQGAARARTLLLDVKYYSQENRSYGRLSDVQKRAGVKILMVEGDGNCRILDDQTESEIENENNQNCN